VNARAPDDSTRFFSVAEPLRYEGPRFKPSARRPFGYRWYEADRLVLGQRMEDQLRFAVCWWHSFVGTGTDAFGGDTFERRWHAAGGDPMRKRATRPRSRSSCSSSCPPRSSPSTIATSHLKVRPCANRT
jgi:xylose isomerase